MSLKNKLHILKRKYRGSKMAPAFNALHTFLYLPDETTHNGTHIKVADDLKRTMNTVIMALVPCLIFGMYNAGYQHYLALGQIEAVNSLEKEKTSLINSIEKMKLEQSINEREIEEKFKNKNTFIGICTKKERVLKDHELEKTIFNKMYKISKADYVFKTSDWMLQEIGYALGKEMQIILLY